MKEGGGGRGGGGKEVVVVGRKLRRKRREICLFRAFAVELTWHVCVCASVCVCMRVCVVLHYYLGAVELEKLPLKKDALRKLKLPFDIKSGGWGSFPRPQKMGRSGIFDLQP